MNNSDIVQKLWSLCDVLRDDGINYTTLVPLTAADQVSDAVQACADQRITAFRAEKGEYTPTRMSLLGKRRQR